MSVVKLKVAASSALLFAVSTIAGAQVWEQVDEKQQLANAWSEVQCEEGSGFRVCEKQAPVQECRPYNANTNAFYVVGQRRGGALCGITRIVWDGNVILNVRKSAALGRSRNQIIYSGGLTVDGYQYTVGRNRDLRPDNDCNGGYYSNLIYEVCRIEVE